MKEITINDWVPILKEIAGIMSENADLLCQLDANMGDGDLGLTMKKGYAALPELFAAIEEADMGRRLSRLGVKLSGVVPSTMGTLMASGWMEGGKRLVGRESVDAAGFAAFLRGFADGIIKRGRCAVGDCTVLDAIHPAASAAETAAGQGAGLSETAQAAQKGAEAGLAATKYMTPKYGKAAVFATKAIGIEDQGATAGMLLVKGLASALQAEGEGETER